MSIFAVPSDFVGGSWAIDMRTGADFMVLGRLRIMCLGA